MYSSHSQSHTLLQRRWKSINIFHSNLSKPYTAMSEIKKNIFTSKTLKKIKMTWLHTSVHFCDRQLHFHTLLWGKLVNASLSRITIQQRHSFDRLQWQDHCSACWCIFAGAPLQSISAQLYPAVPSTWTAASSTTSSSFSVLMSHTSCAFSISSSECIQNISSIAQI